MHSLATVAEAIGGTIEPKVVIEVAFNAVTRSDRHESGFALRFPRILRLRDDKPPGRDRYAGNRQGDLREADVQAECVTALPIPPHSH